MEQTQQVLEYKCPSCGGGLHFGEENQQMKCPFCDSEFDIDTVLRHNANLSTSAEPEFQWENQDTQTWSETEKQTLRSFLCPSCGGELTTDENTAATFCPYCSNPTILPGRVTASLKPDGVIPFGTSREDAKAAFLKLCKGKPLLPKFFTQDYTLEKITGLYVPFWLYACDSDFHGQYKATRIHTWSDRDYNYTRTEYFHLTRAAQAEFLNIPMDASEIMDNAIMESIEPFDFSKLVDFETAYLSGFLADKYDVEALQGEDRIRQRVDDSLKDLLSPSLIGYSTVVPLSRHLNVTHSTAKYVLLPVWMLHTRYKDKTYVFAMNGQTGKMTGTFPICPKRTALWFAGIWAGVTAAASLLLNLFL